MINTVTGTGACPRCGTTTASLRDAAPWCPGCEWNLDAYDPGRREREFGWTWIDRWTHRLASMALAVRVHARAGHGPDRWRSAFAEARAANTDRLPLLRQLSVRDEASLFAAHPPIGLRRQLLAGRPWQDPSVVLTPARLERIDAELTAEYKRFRRTVEWSG
ncbi:hypothetical protein [Micromonospora sp. NPDC005979]|uniref:hypothetical protein n=1 Tax=Micromonospora sp. NPDC005979 TaxID=3156726 RepID=UPI0033A9F23C